MYAKQKKSRAKYNHLEIARFGAQSLASRLFLFVHNLLIIKKNYEQIWPEYTLPNHFGFWQFICHSKELIELSRTTPKLIRGKNFESSYSSWKNLFIGPRFQSGQFICHSKELVESNDIKISFGMQFWAEIQVLESRTREEGSKLVFGVKNSNMQLIVHSKKLI